MIDLKKIKLFLFVTMLLLLVSALCACTGGTTSPADTTDDITVDAPSDQNSLVIADGNGVAFKIVAPFRATNTETKAAQTISSTIKNDYGFDIAIDNDYNEDDPWNKETITNDEYEILIGKTNRTESAELSNVIQFESDWTVRVSGKKIIVYADSSSGYDRALKTFFEALRFSDSGKLSISKQTNKSVLITDNKLLDSIIKEYTAVCQNPGERVSKAFEVFLSKINALSDEGELKAGVASGDVNAKEILIESDSKAGALDLSYYDYVIRVIDNKIAIDTISPLATVSALERLYELIIWQELDDQYVFRFSKDSYNPIVADQSLFVPSWAGRITVPAWMTDFNEKLYAITDPKGRQMSVAHRGDVINYPEDSLEGILSAALMGADVIELDLQLTKDNIIVICHDTTLTNTTNVKELKGTNGLPSSTEISDWTYAQITQLSLLDRSGKVTEYKLPSLYEILSVIKGKCFLMMDDKVGFTRDDILPMEKELEACEVSLYSMFVSSASGTAANNSFSVIKKFSESNPEMTGLAENIKKMGKYLAMSGHSIRSRGWIGGDATTDPYLENEARYLEAYNAGVTLLYTNHVERFLPYIAKTYTASQIPA